MSWYFFLRHFQKCVLPCKQTLSKNVIHSQAPMQTIFTYLLWWMRPVHLAMYQHFKDLPQDILQKVSDHFDNNNINQGDIETVFLRKDLLKNGKVWDQSKWTDLQSTVIWLSELIGMKDLARGYRLFVKKNGTRLLTCEVSDNGQWTKDTGQRTKDKPTTPFPGSDVGLDTARVR